MKIENNFNSTTKKDRFRIEVLDFARMILICFVFVFLCVKFVFQPVTVDGKSMHPTLKDSQFGFSNVIATFFTDPKRFDIVVVENEITGKPWVKRVIGLPGETLEYRNGELWIDGKIIKEDFFDENYVASQTNDGDKVFTPDYGPIKLSSDEYFICGDNRLISKDSRYPGIGPFHRSDIVSIGVFIIH